MKRSAFCLALLILTSSLHAATLEGPVTLVFDESPFSDKVFKKEFGDVMKISTSWRVGDFFGKETVFAGITAKNSGTKPMFFNYYVAFFDKNGKLVGSTGQGTFGDEGVKPGESEQLGSCLIYLPKDKYKEIVSYQVIVYETDVAPKKK